MYPQILVRVVRGLRLVRSWAHSTAGCALGASIEADLQLNDRLLSRCSRLFGTGAEDSRGMPSTIADSMITIAGVTFSITIMARARLQPI